MAVYQVMTNDFDRFVAGNAASLLRTAYLISGDLHEAEDLVQEALIKTAKRWHRVSRMEQRAAYTRRILVNLALDGSTKRGRRRIELADELDDPERPSDRGSLNGHAEQIGTRDELVKALATLPPRQRAVLVLRYFLDLPEAEVASVLDCSLGTVKSTASRGLARLEEAMRPATTDTRSITT
ncbi:MAG: SigE family RNA polymerase sigma factor [Solirubrobacteraceae bacterium]